MTRIKRISDSIREIRALVLTKGSDFKLINYTYFLIAFFILFQYSCNNAPKQFVGNVVLQSIDHQRYYLNQHKGQVTVIIFWATWCNVCKKEMIAFESYKNNLQNSNLHIAAVCFNPEEIDKAKSIVASLKINYPVLLDNGAGFYNRFQTNIAPLTIIIDKNGYIDIVVEGYDEQIMKKITSRIEVLLESHE